MARRVLDQAGSAKTVTASSETASSMPLRSMIVPRRAGDGDVLDLLLDARAPQRAGLDRAEPGRARRSRASEQQEEREEQPDPALEPTSDALAARGRRGRRARRRGVVGAVPCDALPPAVGVVAGWRRRVRRRLARPGRGPAGGGAVVAWWSAGATAVGGAGGSARRDGRLRRR